MIRVCPLCLSMKLFEVVIDQTGFGNEAGRETLHRELTPVLRALDAAAGEAPNKQRHRRVVERLLGSLMNESRRGESFALENSDVDTSGTATQRSLSFKLLRMCTGIRGRSPGSSPRRAGGFERHMMNAIVIYLSLVFVMSVVCFAAYGLDKRRAVNGSRRVPEQTLHILALLGGWPGGLLGQQQFRHKTKKLSFLIVFWCVVMLHVAAVSTATYVFFGSTSSDRNPLQNATSQG